jgi:nucleoside phosphorylase
MNRDQQEPIDFLILTVLDKEFNAVCRQLTLVTDTRTDDKYAFYRGTLTLDYSVGVSAYTIVVLQSNDMGNVAMSNAVTNALHRYTPQATIVVGIAGGVKGKIALGDVAVSKAILPYEVGKLNETGLESRAKPQFADSQLFNHARAFAQKEWHSRMTEERPEPAEPAIQPAVKFGTIASGEKVVANEHFIAELEKLDNTLIAIEMEGSGAANAIRAFGAGAGGFLVIRGISDYADQEKNDGWQEYAADGAAAFAIGLLATKPLSTRSEREHVSRLAERPFRALRAESMSRIHPAGPRDVLLSSGATKVEDAPIDLMQFSGIGGQLANVTGAVKTLTDPDGALRQAAGRADVAELAFAAHMHIPLVVLAGAIVTERVPVRLLDFHSAEGMHPWRWPADDTYVLPDLKVQQIVNDGGADLAFVRISISYPISDEQTNGIFDLPRYETNLRLENPTRGIVRSEAQARQYARVVRTILDDLANSDPCPSAIHLFYAGPISVAFAIGQQYSTSIHPRVIVWNYHDGKYDWSLDLKEALDIQS